MSNDLEGLKSTDVETIDQESEKQRAALGFLGEAFSMATERAVKAMNKKSKLDNVAIFVDYDNVYWTLMNNYSYDPGSKDPKQNIIELLWDRYKQDNVRTFRVYADFERVQTSLTGLQQKRVQIRHVYSNGKEGNFNKNSSDIELCIDAIETTYKDPNISCYVFVTADSDMIPILSRMMYKGKRVELYYLSKAAPQHVDMTNYAHSSNDLLDFLRIKEKQYDVNNYIVESVKFIKDWQSQYSQTDRFLGAPWLRSKLAEKFAVPANIASEILERLRVEELITDSRKELSDKTFKTSIALTEKSESLIRELTTKDAAATLEE